MTRKRNGTAAPDAPERPALSPADIAAHANAAVRSHQRAAKDLRTMGAAGVAVAAENDKQCNSIADDLDKRGQAIVDNIVRAAEVANDQAEKIRVLREQFAPLEMILPENVGLAAVADELAREPELEPPTDISTAETVGRQPAEPGADPPEDSERVTT